MFTTRKKNYTFNFTKDARNNDNLMKIANNNYKFKMVI